MNNGIVYFLPEFALKKLTLYLLLLPHFAWSQTTLSGTVRDEKNCGVAYANVFLQPENGVAIVGYGQSDDKGTYLFKSIKKGKFWLNFSAISYKTSRILVNLTDSSKSLTTNAVLIAEPVPINEVIVTSDKSILIKKDTIIFNVKAFAKGNERIVEDLLKRLPGLVVAEDGGIKVGNREIEKIMIDGDDLFDKGYRILTKNMPAQPIEKIEVYQHYSNNKLLKGIENSEKIALNLKLSEQVKRRWFGNISAGTEMVKQDRYEGFGNLMNFGRKSKFYGITSLNNIGNDAIGDVNYLIRPSEESDPGNPGTNQHAFELLNMSTFSPNLQQNRTLFNQAEVYSMNAIFTLSPRTKMKTMAFLNRNHDTYYKHLFESFSVGESYFSTEENHRLNQSRTTGYGRVDLDKEVSPRSTLAYTLKISKSEKDGVNLLQFNDSTTNELLYSSNRLLEQKILYTIQSGKNKVWLLSGKYISERSPQRYSLDKFFYYDLFPNFAKTDLIGQSSENQMHFAVVEAHLMIRKLKGHLLELKFGNRFRYDLLNTGLSLYEPSNRYEMPAGYGNDLGYSTNDSYLTGTFNYAHQNINLIAALDFHQLYNRKSSLGQIAQQFPLFMNPIIGFKWKLNESSTLLSTYTYNHTNATLLEIFDQYVQKGFRTFEAGTGTFNQLNKSSLYMNYTTGNWTSKSFANLMVLCNLDHDYYGSKSQITPNYCLSEKVVMKNKTFLLIAANANRYLSPLSSTIKGNLSYSKTSYGNFVNGPDFRNIINSNLTFGLEFRSAFNAIFNFHTGTKWSHVKVITTSKNSYTDQSSFLDLNFVFSEKFDLIIQAERYYFGSLDKGSNKYYFLDITSRYQPIANKISFTFSGVNLLNTNTFRNYIVDDVSVSKTEFRLLPRYLLLKAEYRF